MATKLDTKLRNFSYEGEKIGFTLQKFFNLQKGQHIIANGFME